MKKVALTLAIVMAGLTVLTGCTSGGDTKTSGTTGGAQPADKVYEFKMVNQAPPEDVQFKSFEYFAQQLNEKSAGRIKATFYGNSTVGGSNQEQTEMTVSNAVQFTSCPGFVLATLSKDLIEFNVTDYPYLFQTTEELNAFWDGDINKRMREEAEEKLGLKVFPGFNMGWVQIYSNKKPIVHPDDVKGQKIRTSTTETYIAALEKWGVNPTPVNWTETYTALQQKTVDGLTTPSLLAVYQKFYEVQKHMAVINFNPFPHYPVLNKQWYESLPDDLKVIFDECSADYMKKTRELHLGMETEALEILEKEGMQISHLTPEQIEEWKKPVVSIWDEKSALAGKEIIDEVRASLGR